MSTHNPVHDCYQAAISYPDLVNRLIAIGVESYTVDVSSSIMLYRFAEGKIVLHQDNTPSKSIAASFDEQKTIEAVRNTQQGKTDYPTFVNEIAAAGVRFYEAILTGANKRVMYIGIGGYYEESIPL